MIGEKRIAVVIPCYNVNSQVNYVLNGIPHIVDLIVAVNDASSDNTGQNLRSRSDSRLIVLHLETNLGVGGAMVAGYRKALELDADILVKMDGDGQMKSIHLQSLVDPLVDDVADYAKGNRFLHRQELRQMPKVRLAGNILLTFLTKISSGYWHIFDPQNGYVAVRSDFLRDLDLDRLAGCRYFFENEMLIQLNVAEARALDVPIPSHYADEVSSLRISKVITYFPTYLVRGFFYRILQKYVLRDFSIIVPLYFIGAILFVWGFLFGAWNWWSSAASGTPATTGTVMLAVLPLILGFQMVLQGLLFEVMASPRATRPSYKPKHKP